MDGESEYREKAVQLAKLARSEQNPAIKAELHSLAASYLRLADQAAANALSYTVKEDMAQNQPTQAQHSRVSERLGWIEAIGTIAACSGSKTERLRRFRARQPDTRAGLRHFLTKIT